MKGPSERAPDRACGRVEAGPGASPATRVLRRFPAGVAAALCLAGHGSACAAAAETDLAARAAFIEARLDEGRAYAGLWQNGWTAAYAGAGVLHATIAFTSDDHDERVANAVGALRSLTALTLIRLRANPGRHGADPVRAAGPPGSPERLAAAESLMRAAARHAAERGSLSRHALNLGLNAFFGGLIWAFGDGHDALISTLVGVAGGEANLLTRSRRPVDNLGAYRRRYGGELTWAIEPTADGIALRVRF